MRSGMKKVKIILIIIISVLALIVFLQNTETVQTKLLFMSVTMPRALLLILTFLMGFVAGLITTSIILRKSGKPKNV
jgi:putative membrane protein